jgi:uncharacterized OsmC-like protein
METTVVNEVNGVRIDRLQATIEAIKETPAIADFKFRASNNWVAGAQNVSEIKGFYGASQEDESRSNVFRLTADEPDVLLGTNNGPNPTETLLHALASCITTTLVYHAAANGIKVDAIYSTYEGDLDLHGFLGLNLNAPKGYKVIRIEFTIEGDLSRKQKEEILKVGRKFSPVHSMVSKAVPLEVALK